MVEQAKAGLLKDITADVDADGGAWRNTFAPGALAVYSYDGKQYGVPWDMGMVGWWYNKDLFAKAGIQAPPTTWTEFLDAVKKLKAAGITPIALGEKDSWTGMHIWSYLATRIGGQAAFEAALNRKGSFADPAFVQAFEKLQELIALRAVPDGLPRQHARRDAGHLRQREGGHGVVRPMGALRRIGECCGQEGRCQPRHVRLPGGRGGRW